VILGLVLLYSAFLSTRPKPEVHADGPPDPLATRLKLDSTYPTPQGWQPYRVQHVKAGFGLMFGAGAMSGLLGIGSGALKVLAMDHAMRIPFKVSTSTSNFMIGVTAAASAGDAGSFRRFAFGRAPAFGRQHWRSANRLWSGGGSSGGGNDLQRTGGEDLNHATK
jgi:hypothetical protein